MVTIKLPKFIYLGMCIIDGSCVPGRLGGDRQQLRVGTLSQAHRRSRGDPHLMWGEFQVLWVRPGGAM